VGEGLDSTQRKRREEKRAHREEGVLKPRRHLFSVISFFPP
jgi:hypothetical protein